MSKIKHTSVVTSFVFVPDIIDVDSDKAMDFANMFYRLVEPALDEWPESLTIEMKILPGYLDRGSGAEYEMKVSAVKNPMPLNSTAPTPAPAPKVPSSEGALAFRSFMSEFGQNIVGKVTPDDITYTLKRHGLYSVTDLIVHPDKIAPVLGDLRILASPDSFLASNYTPQPPELDSSGKPWNRQVHASTRAKNKDGTWRKKQVWKVKSTKEDILHKRGYITVDETCKMLGLSHHVQIQHIRRKNDLFPKPEYIHGCSGYRRKDVKAWIELFGKPGANQ